MKEEHIRFAEEVANGKNATQAYMIAYGCSHSNAVAHANKISKREDVKAKIAEIKEKRAFRMDWSYKDSVNALKEVILACQAKGDNATIVKAIQELNKMGGLHAPEKKIELKAEIESRTMQEVLANVGYQRITDGTK